MAEKPVIGVMPLYDEKMDSIWTVSYTHLDVYKRQQACFSIGKKYACI